MLILSDEQESMEGQCLIPRSETGSLPTTSTVRNKNKTKEETLSNLWSVVHTITTSVIYILFDSSNQYIGIKLKGTRLRPTEF